MPTKKIVHKNGGTVKKVQAMIEEERTPLVDLARKVLLASMGAVALAQDEIEDFVNRLVERGEIAEKDGRKLIKEVVEKRRKTTKDVEKAVQDVYDRMNVPSKADIDALSTKIAALTKKVDELKKVQV